MFGAQLFGKWPTAFADTDVLAGRNQQVLRMYKPRLSASSDETLELAPSGTSAIAYTPRAALHTLAGLW